MHALTVDGCVSACRYHGLKFLAVVTPDGMLAYLYGPVSARDHDYKVLTEAQMLTGLYETFGLPEAWAANPDQPPFAGGRTHYTLSVPLSWF
jgi:hypothetical protein